MKIKQLIICIALGLTTTVFAETAANDTPPQQQFSSTQVESIESIVHDYLINNPEVLIEASNALRTKMEQDQENKALSAIEKNKEMLFNEPNTPFLGNPQGNQLIVEFFDYQCPHCKEMGDTIKNLVDKNPNLMFVFRDWPIFGGASLTAAKAAIAAKNQGKYFVMHEALLASSNPLSDEKIYAIAISVGLDVTRLKKDMESAAVNDQIKSTSTLAKKLNLSGTPVFIVTNQAENTVKFLPGATNEEKLQELLTEVSTKNQTETAQQQAQSPKQ